jgi:hypothetical protein
MMMSTSTSTSKAHAMMNRRRRCAMDIYDEETLKTAAKVYKKFG